MSNNNFGWVFWKDPSPRAKLADDSKLAGTTKLETLVRELIQNAADARVGNPARLVVEDGWISIPTVWDVLRLQELKDHIDGTLAFAKAENPNNRIIPKCNGQLSLLGSPRCRYLKFSDYNTKGLEGILKFDKTKAIWKLLFDDGTSAGKTSSSAGGVGVGKNATFPFSQLSTVIYVTKTDEGYGLVGSARLNSSKINGATYQPEGNLLVFDDYEKVISGDCESIRALEKEDILPIQTNLFDREEKGSDVVILGTDGNTALSDPYWAKKFALYAIINFYPAIENGVFTLEVKQTGQEAILIKADSVDCLIESFEADEDDSQVLDDLIHDARLVMNTLAKQEENENYRIVKHSDPVLGDFTLYMNALPEIDGKRWHLFRSFGMKTVTRDARCQRPVFSVVTIDNKEGSDYLLAAESGNHTEYDYQPLGDKAKEVQASISSFERWVTQEIGAFGRVDSSQTDIELAGLTSFIALSDDIKVSGAEGGVKPLLELENPIFEKKNNKKKQRKRDTSKPDPEGTLMDKRKEQWNHNEGSHKNWGHERDTDSVMVPVVPGEGTTAYDRLVQIKATFRDIHLPYSNQVELIGKISNAVYKSKRIDISVLAVNEQGGVNDYLPKVISATDLTTGEVLTNIENGHLIKGVLVGNDLYIHLEVLFSAPFRSSLIETASTVQHIEQSKSKQEETKDESSE